MCPSYCRIRIPLKEATERFARWFGLSEVGPLVATDSAKAMTLAVDENGNWRGPALFVSECSGWTLFNDLSGGLGWIPAAEWLRFAENDELVAAGYNDSMGTGELTVIKDSVVRREFRDDSHDPDSHVDEGVDREDRLESWVEVASFVDADPQAFSDQGWLWILRRA